MIYQLKDISARTIIRHDLSVKIISAHIHLLPVNKLEQNGLFVFFYICSKLYVILFLQFTRQQLPLPLVIRQKTLSLVIQQQTIIYYRPLPLVIQQKTIYYRPLMCIQQSQQKVNIKYRQL